MRLPKTLQQADAFLSAQPFTSELIIVENGSTDNTLAIATDFAARSDRIRVIHEKQAGKGNAVRTGMLNAQGAYRFMADADLSMPIEEILRFLPPQLEGYDIIIGSREAPGAERFNEPDFRHIGGRLVNFLIRLLAFRGFQDTQCGFKLFTAEAADFLFRQQTMTGWSFDIEILFIAQMHGLSIYELGIPWHYDPHSKIQPVKDAIHMLLDILRIRKNAWSGRYRRKVNP